MLKITDQPILLPELLAEWNEMEHGAQLVFTGIVRNHNQGKKVLGVSYDAHEELALHTFKELEREAKNKWGKDLGIQILHRRGRLNVGEISLVIVVSSRHRDESYQASRYLIEELKNRAPIWKQEHYEDGDSAWLQGHALCGHNHEHTQLKANQ